MNAYMLKSDSCLRLHRSHELIYHSPLLPFTFHLMILTRKIRHLMTQKRTTYLNSYPYFRPLVHYIKAFEILSPKVLMINNHVR
jgi:hypothetical protein